MGKIDFYIITNICNNKQYVGMTRQGYLTRFKMHKRLKYKNKDKPLYADMYKFGTENFKVELLCSYDERFFERKKDVDLVEYDLTTKYNTWFPNGYNIAGNINAWRHFLKGGN